MDTNGQDDEDFPLADHPGPSGPKAGDPETNRARDIMHLDVTRRPDPPYPFRPRPEPIAPTASRPEVDFQKTMLSPEAPVMRAWRAFNESGGYSKAISNFDLFMAGWTARDSQ